MIEKSNLSVGLMLIIWAAACVSHQPKLSKLKYPQTEQVDSFSIHYGQTIYDPYRWLELDTTRRVKQWIAAQNALTNTYLEHIGNRREIEAALTRMWNYEKRSAPFTQGQYQYYYKNDGLQNQSVLYQVDAQGRHKTFIDPNTFSADGTTALAALDFDSTGSLYVMSLSPAGSDWRKLVIKEVATSKQIDDTLTKVKFGGIAWVGKKGFFYSKYKETEGSVLSQKTDQHLLMFHKLGTPQSADKVIFGDLIKRRYVTGTTTDDERYLIISAANTTSGNELYYIDLRQPELVVKPIIQNFENENTVIHHHDDTLYIITNKNAPNKRLIKTHITNAAPGNWVDVIGEQPYVMNISKGAGYFFITYIKDALHEVHQYSYTGQFIRKIKLPGLGTVSGFAGKPTDTLLYYTFTNYTTPAEIYAYHPQKGTSTLYFRPDANFNPDEYTTKQIFYSSTDGTQVPMLITHKKNLHINGQTPTLLYGYGGFNISILPSYNVPFAYWLQQGGLLAVPNIRGGGEYGKKWHIAGTKQRKKQVFEDFESAAEYLIANKYTSPKKLAIYGRSNGGLLVGAVMTRRPDLMRVALPTVGVLDMLRYHKFTAGAGWAYDYGTADEDSAMFAYLKSYSPVHNVHCDKTYPATLIITGDHDDRVVPAHSYKFAAALQQCSKNPHPLLLRVDVNTGHGAGKPLKKTITEWADMLAFTLKNIKK